MTPPSAENPLESFDEWEDFVVSRYAKDSALATSVRLARTTVASALEKRSATTARKPARPCGSSTG